MTRPLRARIDLGALQHNLLKARQLAPHSHIMAVVKANGYGHGMVRVAQALHDADGFGVACLEEAVNLREVGIQKPITLLEGFFDSDELDAVSHYRLMPVLHTERQIRQLETALLPQPIAVWLKADTACIGLVSRRMFS